MVTGVAFTRLITGLLSRRYAALSGATISVGPCQTPALGFVVARRSAIKSFEPRTYYELRLTLRGGGGGGGGGVGSGGGGGGGGSGGGDDACDDDGGGGLAVSWSRGRLYDARVARLLSQESLPSIYAVYPTIPCDDLGESLGEYLGDYSAIIRR